MKSYCCCEIDARIQSIDGAKSVPLCRLYLQWKKSGKVPIRCYRPEFVARTRFQSMRNRHQNPKYRRSKKCASLPFILALEEFREGTYTILPAGVVARTRSITRPWGKSAPRRNGPHAGWLDHHMIIMICIRQKIPGGIY